MHNYVLHRETPVRVINTHWISHKDVTQENYNDFRWQFRRLVFFLSFGSFRCVEFIFRNWQSYEMFSENIVVLLKQPFIIYKLPKLLPKQKKVQYEPYPFFFLLSKHIFCNSHPNRWNKWLTAHFHTNHVIITFFLSYQSLPGPKWPLFFKCVSKYLLIAICRW